MLELVLIYFFGKKSQVFSNVVSKTKMIVKKEAVCSLSFAAGTGFKINRGRLDTTPSVRHYWSLGE